METKNKRGFKHGLRYHPLYTLFYDIRSRCYYPGNVSYHRYGGRGISMCDEWKDNIKAFCEWALINGWEKGLEIDRKENDGNYEPSNCRFVTGKINSRNRRDTRKVVYNNETISIIEASKKYNIKYQTLYSRLSLGWTVERAITSLIQRKR